MVADEAEDPFALLDDQPVIEGVCEAGIGGGWVGYLGYGLGQLVERLPPAPSRPVPLPRSMLAFYDHLLCRDPSGRWWFEALWSDEQSARLESRLETWRWRGMEGGGELGYACGPFLSNPAPESHVLAVARAIEHIRSGDVYQVNVCTRLESEFSGDPAELFAVGATGLRPRFGAYLGLGSSAVASFSPELFLRRQGRRVLSSPIKGTAKRNGRSYPQRERLVGSAKDRAENVMIVDLVRNDLGRVCRYGSISVAELCRPEEHPGVWHLVSDVTGELSDAVSDADLLRATFPPGSVTGAPKVRAMELVSSLETTGREVYTGAIGIASPVSGLELNVAIRTFEVAAGKIWLGVGGGIVADSDPDLELEECFEKAEPLLSAVGAGLGKVRSRSKRPAGSARDEAAPGAPDVRAGVFETMLAVDGRPVDLESHLGRLSSSVSSLYGSRPPARLGTEVTELAATRLGPQRLRVRVWPSVDGELSSELEASPAPEAFSGGLGPGVVLVPVPCSGGLGSHKWHDRRGLSDRRDALGLGPLEQLLLVDDDGTVLESERANVFAVFGALVRTPPLDGRILAGTTREVVMRESSLAGLQVSVEPLALCDLGAADEVFLTSAIRGLTKVIALDGHRWQQSPVAALLAQALCRSWRIRAGAPSASRRYARRLGPIGGPGERDQ